MKKATVFIITLLLATTVSHAQWGWGKGKKIKGNGEMTTISRTTSDYDEVAVAGSFDVELVSGSEGKITLEGESNLLQYVETEVDGDKLKIKIKKGYSLRVSNNKKLLITVPFKDLRTVSLSGSGDVYTKNATVKANKFKMALAGSGDITYKGNPSTEDTKVSGSGSISMN